MKWLPTFGWAGLAFADRMKLLALLFQAGAGMSMTFLAAYALWRLALLQATWPVFYIGGIALIIVGIVVTGFGAILYKRTVEFNAFGASFKAQDQEGAVAMAQQVKEISNAQSVQPPVGEGDVGGGGAAAPGAGGNVPQPPL